MKRAHPALSRRGFLRASLGLAAAAFLAPPPACALARPKFSGPPFTLGVASGSPWDTGVVLWTRLAPDPLNGGGMGDEAIEVQWELSRDAQFRSIARKGKAIASAGRAHAVHVDVDGLEPGRGYFYRFMAGGEVSPTGRTRIPPAPGKGDERLRFAVASCQQYEQGWYPAYRHMRADEPDLVVFLGDYIYESSWGRDHVRKHASPEPYTLGDYRNRYAQYKSDADLKDMHAAAPWLYTWDDHEVDNDYAGERGEDLLPDFLARRAAAYQACFEHLPLRRAMLPEGPGMRLHERYRWGGLAEFSVLDGRQYRSHQACPKSGRGGSNTVGAQCAARLDPALTLLGTEQEKWLADGLAASTARWNLVAQQTLMAQAGRGQDEALYWTDGWDGYPQARARLLGTVAASRVRNPVVLSGDVHATYVADLRVDFDRPSTAVVATEFCGTSITSQGPDAKRVARILERNPHIHYGNGAKRGYLLVDVTANRMATKLRAMETVKRPEAKIETLASWVVEDGIAGARPA
jgi:alkaline phosphatase D